MRRKGNEIFGSSMLSFDRLIDFLPGICILLKRSLIAEIANPPAGGEMLKPGIIRLLMQ
jgi:hypothetical protein